MATPAPPSPPVFAPGSTLARASRQWWRNALRFTALAAIAWVPATVLSVRGAAAVAGQDLEVALPQQVRTFLLVNLFMTFAGALAEGAITLGVLADAGGERPGALRMVSGSSERYLRLLAVNAVCSSLAVGGFLVLPLLGLLLQSFTFIALPVALAEPALPVLNVLLRTWELARGRRLFVFLFVVSATALGIVTEELVGLAARAAPSLPGWAPVTAQAVVASLQGGFVAVAAVAMYSAFSAAPRPDARRGLVR